MYGVVCMFCGNKILSIFLYMNVCEYVCVYVIYEHRRSQLALTSLYLYVCMYVCMYVCKLISRFDYFSYMIFTYILS